MRRGVIEVEGTHRSDGTLVLDEKLPLPAGRVRLAVEPLPREEQPDPDRFWAMMHGIWEALQAAGHQPRTREQIDADINALREEAEEQMKAVERLHEECERGRQKADEGGSGDGVP